MKRWTLFFGLAAVVVLLGFFLLGRLRSDKPAEETVLSQATPHFVDSTPLDGDLYAMQPINITINFDSDLANGSKVSVKSSDDRQWVSGDARIEDVNTALKADLKQDMPDDNYEVDYTACWPDGTCNEGFFKFTIDTKRRTQYVDMRGKSEVVVKMFDLNFDPGRIIISPGTKVIWENKESANHFVNTETHPEHTYFPEQNSSSIKEGESFSTTFTTPGQYNYHCSAHVPQGMLGSIIVSN